MHDEYLLDGSRPVEELSLSLKVPANLLKQAFTELQALMSKTAYSKVIRIKYEEEYLFIEATTSIRYSAKIPVTESNIKDKLSVVCNFEKLVDILPGRGLIDVMLTPVFVKMTNTEFEASLMVCQSDVDYIPELTGDTIPMRVDDVKLGLRKILSLTTIANTFKKGSTILFVDNFMQIRYSTIWVECSSSALNTQLDLASSTVLEKFLYTAKAVEVYDSEEFIAMKKDLSTIYIPKQETTSIQSLDYYFDNADLVAEKNINGFSNKIQSLTRTISKGDAKVTILDNSIVVECKGDNIIASVSTGDRENSNQVLDSFTIRLEFLNNLLQVLGETIKVYRTGDLICIKGHLARVIISSR